MKTLHVDERMAMPSSSNRKQSLSSKPQLVMALKLTILWAVAMSMMADAAEADDFDELLRSYSSQHNRLILINSTGWLQRNFTWTPIHIASVFPPYMEVIIPSVIVAVAILVPIHHWIRRRRRYATTGARLPTLPQVGNMPEKRVDAMHNPHLMPQMMAVGHGEASTTTVAVTTLTTTTRVLRHPVNTPVWVLENPLLRLRRMTEGNNWDSTPAKSPRSTNRCCAHIPERCHVWNKYRLPDRHVKKMIMPFYYGQLQISWYGDS